MRCPFCGDLDTQVKDSRPSDDHISIRRRRHCSSCAGRFTTYERVQLRDLFVLKKKNQREIFDRDKLERSIRIALQKRKSVTLIVGEQVGWSLVSEYKIGNKYIERIGELQKMITKISKDNWLALNGRAIKIDEISLEIPC